MGQGAPRDRVGRCLRHRDRGGAARHAADLAGRGRARLPAASRRAGPPADRPRQPEKRAAEPGADPPARRGRRDDRPRRRQRLGPGGHLRRADPAAGAAGTPACQRAQPAAGPAAAGAGGRAGDGAADPAGAAAHPGRPAVGTRPPPPRHPPGRGATARRDRNDRGGDGGFLSVVHADRQHRHSGAAAVEPVHARAHGNMRWVRRSTFRSSRAAG